MNYDMSLFKVFGNTGLVWMCIVHLVLKVSINVLGKWNQSHICRSNYLVPSLFLSLGVFGALPDNENTDTLRTLVKSV